MNYGVGIDLGTTRCCVAIQDNNGLIQTVPNDIGKNTTPSCVFFSGDNVQVGESALSAPRVGKNLIYDAKRIIGRQYEDAAVTKNRRLWSFDVVRETRPPDDGKAMIKIEENGQSRLIAPEEVSAELLKKLREYAKSFGGGDDIKDAVITHPAYFDTKQRLGTEKAAKLAGFENIKLISEPTAAAIAFGIKTGHENKTILIYDLGGGTFDVSIGKIVDEQLDILAVHGLSHLGGEDFDTAIVDDFTRSFEEAHTVSFPIEDPTQIRRLRNEARSAKETMSRVMSPQTIEMSITISGKSYQHTYKIDRKRFNELCNNYFESTMGVVDETLAKAELNISQINDVLMVGGSARIPRIKELVGAKFPKANIMNNINPDEAAAIGAAVLASQMDPSKPLPEEPLSFNNDIPNIDDRHTYVASHANLNMDGTLSTPSNAEPTKNKQTTSSNSIKMKNMVCIGIDLGTTYSCVAIVENGKPRIIFNEEDNNFTPSIVSYGDNNEILVGNYALNYSDLSRILYDSKRLLGWGFMYRLPIAEDRLLWTFDSDTRNGLIGYVLNRGTEKERFLLPEDVSADILRKLKLIAEKYVGNPIIEAVVAIPAFFQADQIEATKRAVQLAGLELKMLVKEPTAAAIAYNEDRKLEDSNIMIFDFGGGTLDINICEIKNGKLAIKAVHGDEHLGGQDFDGIIMNYALQEYTELSNNDIFGDKRLIKRLRTECRLAKEALSFDALSYSIHLDINIDDHSDLNVQLTKEKLNELCKELYTRTSNLIDDTLRMAKLRTDDIDHVILVGGSTRIPAVKNLLEGKFGSEKLKFNINPDEAVVFGAAILADAIEKEIEIPLINDAMVELTRNINDSQIGNNSYKILFYFCYQNNDKQWEGRIGLFNSFTCSVEEIAKFHNYYRSDEVATTQNKIFGIGGNKSFEIFDLNTRQILRGPGPPEWRIGVSVIYFKGKLYYLGGENPETDIYMGRVDVLIDGKWKRGPTFPHPIYRTQTITCNGILYVIDDRKIYRLSDDERNWIEVGEIPERLDSFGVASLNEKIYITGGANGVDVLKSCLCFDPSTPVDSRIFRIADMNYARYHHSIVVANGKLYAVGGYQNIFMKNACNLIEEYDPQKDEWREVREFNIE